MLLRFSFKSTQSEFHCKINLITLNICNYACIKNVSLFVLYVLPISPFIRLQYNLCSKTKALKKNIFKLLRAILDKISMKTKASKHCKQRLKRERNIKNELSIVLIMLPFLFYT